ncbi:MAG TPA: NAD(P)/FAD-dependent oxidoreductase [Candidatus Limnocylindria bacterium]|nr:NAD(P)/FAD-dependent oxidoreductase [Candidatus Limnocylindria bacterium]
MASLDRRGTGAMTRIVVLGGGFAGVAVAHRLEQRLRPGEAEVTVVSRDNFTLFTPMLPEVSSGGIELRHVVAPVRVQLRRSTFVLGEVSRIDLEQRWVDAQHPITGDVTRLEYDQLVLALGSVTSTFNIPGVAEHTLPLKTLEDAGALRNRVVAALEQAVVTPPGPERERLLTFAVVGGGYTGCECAGELVDFFHSVLPYYKPLRLSDVRMVLVEAGKALLPDLPAGMGRYTTSNLAKRKVDLVLGDGVTRIDDEGIELQSGRKIPSATIVWSAGVRPSPVLKDLPLVTHARNGGIVVNQDMSVIGAPGVWAIGDCAWIPNKPNADLTDRNAWYPATAQHAIREGPVLADNLLASLRGEPTKPFEYRSLGTMASLGARRGVAALPGGFVLTGFLAWILWRTYYLARLPGLDRRLRVTFDWTLGLLFPRDIAEIRLYSERNRREVAREAGMAPPSYP